MTLYSPFKTFLLHRTVPGAGKQATGAKRGKTGNRSQARENKPPVPSAGKQATGVQRERASNCCQEQENQKPDYFRWSI